MTELTLVKLRKAKDVLDANARCDLVCATQEEADMINRDYGCDIKVGDKYLILRNACPVIVLLERGSL